MLAKKHHSGIAAVQILLFFVFLLIHGSAASFLTIKHAYPFFLLSLLTAFSVFSGPAGAALTGLLCGACVDSIAADSYCFNAIVLLLLCTGVHAFANNIFNKNLKAVCALSLLSCVFYYLCYWLAFILPRSGGAAENATYLLRYGLPSALYSAVFVIPFYFLFRFLDKKKNE